MVVVLCILCERKVYKRLCLRPWSDIVMSLCCAQVMNTNVGLYCKLRAARLHQCKLRKQSYSKVLFAGQISFLTRCKNLAKFMASSPCAFHFFIIRSQRYGMRRIKLARRRATQLGSRYCLHRLCGVHTHHTEHVFPFKLRRRVFLQNVYFFKKKHVRWVRVGVGFV